MTDLTGMEAGDILLGNIQTRTGHAGIYIGKWKNLPEKIRTQYSDLFDLKNGFIDRIPFNDCYLVVDSMPSNGVKLRSLTIQFLPEQFGYHWDGGIGSCVFELLTEEQRQKVILEALEAVKEKVGYDHSFLQLETTFFGSTKWKDCKVDCISLIHKVYYNGAGIDLDKSWFPYHTPKQTHYAEAANKRDNINFFEIARDFIECNESLQFDREKIEKFLAYLYNHVLTKNLSDEGTEITKNIIKYLTDRVNFLEYLKKTIDNLFEQFRQLDLQIKDILNNAKSGLEYLRKRIADLQAEIDKKRQDAACHIKRANEEMSKVKTDEDRKFWLKLIKDIKEYLANNTYSYVWANIARTGTDSEPNIGLLMKSQEEAETQAKEISKCVSTGEFTFYDTSYRVIRAYAPPYGMTLKLCYLELENIIKKINEIKTENPRIKITLPKIPKKITLIQNTNKN